MEAAELAAAVALGFAAGLAGGLVGVGGGVLFVPALILFLDVESTVEAVGTSLLAIVLVAVVGAWRQHGYGNLRLKDGIVVGALSPLGVAAGTVLSNAVGERALELSFAAVQVYFAWRLARRALAAEDDAR